MAKHSCTEEELDRAMDREAKRLGPLPKGFPLKWDVESDHGREVYLKTAWVEVGRENPWIRQADDPEFDWDSFGKEESVSSLVERLLHGNWCLGQAFFIGDLCFINQVDGGDEWLVIKGSVPFESFTCEAFGREELEVIIGGFLECDDAFQCERWLHHWHRDVRVYLDGNSWCAVKRENWMSYPECPAGFGPSIDLAVESLKRDEGGES